jgi:hypothetical protein
MAKAAKKPPPQDSALARFPGLADVLAEIDPAEIEMVRLALSPVEAAELDAALAVAARRRSR